MFFLSFVVLIGINANSFAKRIYVNNVAKTYEVLNDLRPGDSLVFKKGEYKDIQLLLKQSGSSNKPIVLIAETSGSVIFCGDVKVAIYGSYTELNGIYFTKGNLQ